MPIYTGRGDDGMTDLRDMSRVSKASTRIEAYGTVDELNALIGTIRPTDYDDVDDDLRTIQQHLHIVQAALANPGSMTATQAEMDTNSGGEPETESNADADGTERETESVTDDNAETNATDRSPVITAEHVELLEEWIDSYEGELDPLTSFILPSGSTTGAQLHHARTVCRRAERRTVALLGPDTDMVTDAVVRYLNRLSDTLFTFARVVNRRDGVPEESPTY